MIPYTIQYNNIYTQITQIDMKSQRRPYKMDFIQNITLSPFQKYTQFGIFPWKFIFHLLLVILCTYQSLRIVSIQDKHIRIQQQVFSTVYLQNQDGTNSYPYYSLKDFTDTFFDIFAQTQLLNQTLLQYSDVQGVRYRLQVYYSEMDGRIQRGIIFQGNQTEFMEQIQEIPIHQGNYTEMKLFIQQVQNMQMQISNLITYISMDDKNKMNECLNWTVHIEYNFQSFANVQSTLEAQSQSCLVQGTVNAKDSLISIHIAVMLVAGLSLFAAWRQIYQISKEYMIYKRSMVRGSVEDSKFKANVDWKKNWEQLGFFDKMKFFDFWFIITATANFFQVFGALVAFLDQIVTANLLIFAHKEFLIGFGVMLSWITMLMYLQYNNNLNLMTATLSKSWSNLIMFLLGVMPFFLGFVFLGQTIFWKYSKFESTSSSAITLFSLLNGDIVNDTFLQTWSQGLIGQVYLIIFMILFYTAVQNVFVTIIMQGYQQSIKQRQYKKMIQQKQQMEKSARYQNLINVSIEEEAALGIGYSPEMSPQQNTNYGKLRVNGLRIDKILGEIIKVKEEVKESDLTSAEKIYLRGILKENLESLAHSLKLQLNKMNKISNDKN